MRIARQEIRRAREQGLVVRELKAEDLADPATRQRLHAVSGDWMKTKRVADRQLRVYCRHFDPEDLDQQLDGEVRLFVAERRGGPNAPLVATMSEGGLALRQPMTTTTPQGKQTEPEIEGFLLLDPMYREDGKVFGYVNSSNRMRPGANPGTLKLLMDHVLELLRAQDMEFLHLGLTPFHHSKRSAQHFPGGAAWMDFGTKFFFKLGNNLYAFKRLAAAKSKFGGGIADDGESYNDPAVIMSHVYVGHSVRYPFLFLMDMYGTFEYIGFVGDDILSSIVKGLAPPTKKEAKPVLQQVGKKELKKLASCGSLPSMASSVGGLVATASSVGGGGKSVDGGAPALLVRAAAASSGGGAGAPAGVTVLRARAQAVEGPKPPKTPAASASAVPPRPPRLQTMTSAPAGCAVEQPSQQQVPAVPVLERRKSRPLSLVPSLPPVPGSPSAPAAVATAGLHASEDAVAVVPDDDDEPDAAAPLVKSSNSSSGVSLTANAATMMF
jgi:hypothetical protein